VAVGFTNGDQHRATLLGYAGQTVVVDGAWRTDRIEIASMKTATQK
jgi:hypothetical protein